MKLSVTQLRRLIREASQDVPLRRSLIQATTAVHDAARAFKEAGETETSSYLASIARELYARVADYPGHRNVRFNKERT